MNGDVFAVAEARCKKEDEGNKVFAGVASQLFMIKEDNKPEEVLKEAKGSTQVLEEGGSSGKRVDVSQPTTVVKGSDVYMLVGVNNWTAAADDQASPAAHWGLLLAKGTVSGGDNKKNPME
ncbi:trans-sialidase [Trypanosoma cruzi]|nr:trans-sialidase [Trypanosoma cruzi]